MATQIDEHCVLASVQEVDLERDQLGEPVTVLGLPHTRVLGDSNAGRQRERKTGLLLSPMWTTVLTLSAPVDPRPLHLEGPAAIKGGKKPSPSARLEHSVTLA